MKMRTVTDIKRNMNVTMITSRHINVKVKMNI
jgi:hypothetical protein